MVESHEANRGRACAPFAHEFGAGPVVRGAPGHRAANLESGVTVGDQRASPRHFGEHPGDTVEAALVALANVVEEGCDNEVFVAAAPLQKPAGGSNGMDDVAGMLAGEKAEQTGRQPFTRKGKVGACGFDSRGQELADALPHQTPISRKTSSLRLRMIQPSTLNWGATKPMTNSDMRMPMP